MSSTRPTVTDTVSGLVLLDKAPGQTSFQALGPLKRRYGRSLGHTGTLDSFAEGLLVVLTGRLTRLNPLFTAMDKVYEAQFTFGRETDTLDPTGQTVRSGPVPPGGVADWRPEFVGDLLQVPPDYSAVHVDGRRASDRVRSGETLALPPRPVTVYALEILDWAEPVLSVRLHCSKGTYVRSVARDWGRLAGCGAHVSRLRRTRVGPFTVPAATLEFQSPAQVFEGLGIPLIRLDGGAATWARHGRPPLQVLPGLRDRSEPRVAFADEAGEVLALAQRAEGAWSYVFVAGGVP